jgi:hypothetical protein
MIASPMHSPRRDEAAVGRRGRESQPLVRRYTGLGSLLSPPAAAIRLTKNYADFDGDSNQHASFEVEFL